MPSMVGILSESNDSPQKVLNALQILDNRGLDGVGIWCEKGITKSKYIDTLNDGLEGKAALGHMDLSMVGGEKRVGSFSDSQKKIALVHNGKIYNDKNFCRNLLNKSYSALQNDSEVIFRLIERNLNNGLLDATQEAVKQLEGVYALAVSDGSKIIVARDPVGIKQIYYAENKSGKAFASEMKSLWAMGFERIQRLEPGHLLEIKCDDIRQYPAFLLPKPEISINDVVKAKTKYKGALVQSVAKRVDGLDHVSLGLSGGVDSALIAKIVHDLGVNLSCYSVGYRDSNDIQISRRLSQDLDIHFRKFELDDDNVEEALDKINRSIECRGLVQIEAAVFLHFAAKMAREDGIKIMLTGQGPDELFGGYPWYLDVVKEKGLQVLHQYMWNDLIHAHLETLERENKMASAHFIELRAPFLDLDVIDVAMSIDVNLKVESAEDTRRKRIHRLAAQELGVPDYVAWRPKEAAQRGSGVHEALENLAVKAGFTPEVVEQIQYEPIAQDYGSNYRYREGYGKPHVWLYLDKVAYDAELIPPDELQQVEYYLGKING